MVFTNQAPGYQISTNSLSRPQYRGFSIFNSNNVPIKGVSPAPVLGSNAFGGSVRGKGNQAPETSVRNV